jgi:hypothetical protein
VPNSDELSQSESHREEALREAMTMVLYLSIVMLATLTALPSGTDAGDGHGVSGVHGAQLLGLIWGTTIGLALAHWFAFRLTARAFGGGKVGEGDLRIALGGLAGAALVAVLCTIPVVLVGDESEVKVTAFVPALIVGFAGYGIARAADRPKHQALIMGGIAIVLGLAVAAVKNFLLGH